MITVVTKELASAGNSFLGDEILKALTHNVIGKWIDTAAAAIVVYEWLITLDMEIRLIWCNDANLKQQNFTRVLYLVNRYSVILDVILNGFFSYGLNVGACKTLLSVLGTAIVLGLYLSEFILALRVCVVWNKNKIVIFLLGATYIGSFIHALTTFYLMLRPVKFFTLLPFGGCLADVQGSTLWISYVLLLIYDIVMLALMGYPTVKEYKLSQGRTELVKCVYDEGIIFYVFLSLVDTVIVILQQTVPDGIFFFPIAAQFLRSMLAARTVLHIREYSSQRGGVTSTSRATSIRFGGEAGERERESEV